MLEDAETRPLFIALDLLVDKDLPVSIPNKYQMDHHFSGIYHIEPFPACFPAQIKNRINSNSTRLIRSIQTMPSHLPIDSGTSPGMKMVVASIGFFSDAYDLFVINMVLIILQELYSTSDGHKAIITTTALIGAITGQLAFGYLGDVFGRTIVWVATISLIIIGSIGSSLAFASPSTDIYTSLALWRLVLGIGIGGEYPISSAVSSEASGRSVRGGNVALVFSAQGWGNLMAPLSVLMLLSLSNDSDAGLEFVWRFALALGALPSLVTLPYRWKLFKAEGISESQLKSVSLKERLNMVYRNGKALFGTSSAWFIFDVTFYANGLFSATILTLLGFDENKDIHEKVQIVALENVIIALMGLPGYYCAVYLIDRWGRRRLQQLGFLCMSIVYFIMGIWVNQLIHYRNVFVALYGLTFYFSNLGPNTTTFVVPSEVFDHEVRTTCSGISAASGKMGAVVGASIFPFLISSSGPKAALLLSGSVALIGLGVSLLQLVPETMDRPLIKGTVEDVDVQLAVQSESTSLNA